MTYLLGRCQEYMHEMFLVRTFQVHGMVTFEMCIKYI